MISVIIPTLNEAQNLAKIFDVLSTETIEYELIIVDGGSTDGTINIASDKNVRLLETLPGRGLQLRAGAKLATGDVLWFLHADSQVSTGSLAAIEQAMKGSPEAPGGNFHLHFDGNDAFSDWLNGFYRRIRAKGVYYGDSGVFVRRSVYDKIGGIRALALMEDYDFNRRLEQCGSTLVIGNPVLVTSSRRFQNRHKWLIIAQWTLIHMLFYLRLPSPLLAKIYNSTRRRRSA